MEEPTTQKGLRSTIAQRAADIKAAVVAFKQNLATHLSAAETAAAAAQTDANNAKIQLEAATDSNAAVSQLKTDATTAYAKFNTIMTDALNPKTGAKTLVAAVADAHEEAQGLKTEISDFRDESLKMQSDIEKSRNESQEMQGTLITVLTDSQTIREKIEKTYKIATDAGLAGSLSQRKGEIGKQMKFWAGVSLAAFIATIIIIAILIPNLTKQSQEAAIIVGKLFYVSPTAFFTLFAITQYRNERRLIEEYAFKAAMANSLESYTELLGREFPKYKKEVLEFVLPVMTDIYDREPLVSPKLTFSWSLGSKIAKLDATIKEEASTITKKTVQATSNISDQLEEISEVMTHTPAKKPKVVATT